MKTKRHKKFYIASILLLYHFFISSLKNTKGIFANTDSMLIHFTSTAQGLSTDYKQKWSSASSYSHFIKQTSEHIVWHKPLSSRKAPNDIRADVTSWGWVIVNSLPRWALRPVLCLPQLYSVQYLAQMNMYLHKRRLLLQTNDAGWLMTNFHFWSSVKISHPPNRITTQK